MDIPFTQSIIRYNNFVFGVLCGFYLISINFGFDIARSLWLFRITGNGFMFFGT